MLLLAPILLLLILLRRQYSKFLRKGERELFGFRELLLHMERGLSLYPAGQAELLESFESEPLSEVGFLATFRTCGSLREAYNLTRPALSMPKSADRALSECFGRFGGGYLDDELARVRYTREELEGIGRTLGEENEKRLKLVSAVGLSLALGVGLIFI